MVNLCGSGTEKDPYQITTFEELKLVNQDLSSYYDLVCDINAEETRTMWGRGFNPIGNTNEPFKGTFEGNDNQIENLRINRPEQNDIGIFANNEGQIFNLSVKNATITGNNYVGGIVGLNRGKVDSLRVTGDVSGERNVGGLVGSNLAYVVSSHSIGDVSGHKCIGGLIGCNEFEVKSSYSKGDVFGYKCVGGLVGWNNGELESSYAVGCVLGEEFSSGLIGSGYRKEQINSSFMFSKFDEDSLSEVSDLAVSKDGWEISYIVDRNILYLEVDGEYYSCSGVPPKRVQEMVKFLEYDKIEITDKFRSSVVATV